MPHYLLVADFYVAVHPSVRLEFRLAPDGKLLWPDPAHSVPPCASLPVECHFISESEAIQLARRAGLPEGVRPWQTSFHFYAGLNEETRTFVWSVQATTKEGRSGALGRLALFDANTGRPWGISSWFEQRLVPSGLLG